jgi:hypothetical protein
VPQIAVQKDANMFYRFPIINEKMNHEKEKEDGIAYQILSGLPVETHQGTYEI